ncbi:hypothetical protein [Pollutibacter soli]|uniref:hypothetical protein n=1 Tax=Pollutibacter soli TaxID=3034157 RepID=UPI003013FED7
MKFSSQKFDDTLTFHDAWKKKLSLATKLEIKYDDIRSVRKNDNESDIVIWYKSWSGLNISCVFSFLDVNDYEIFFTYLEKKLYYKKDQITLTPLKAVSSYLIGLVMTIAFTLFAYYEALEIANGTAEEPRNGKEIFFNYVIGLLGDKGVIAVGLVISAIIVYKMRPLFLKPPQQQKYQPPHV